MSVCSSVFSFYNVDSLFIPFLRKLLLLRTYSHQNVLLSNHIRLSLDRTKVLILFEPESCFSLIYRHFLYQATLFYYNFINESNYQSFEINIKESLQHTFNVIVCSLPQKAPLPSGFVE